MYEIKIKKSVKKDLDALDDKTYIRIDKDIQRLGNNPFPGGVKKLRGEENRYRIREGKYRILYEVDQKNKTIVIYRIKLRKTAYD
ncbi:MAG: ParE toxin of type II toxin-antitoxin system, parDE [Candidatus Argoarchaeum ethanivorans]|uniref:ParE toxin of type II toxin-antitoxin system, parDE n=1 Tax=Candidatus Argoarchaeum ethanivorans TaxID=2608793 RepID=A0A811T6S4_9EURY|nr:MAG: ParE toxin of type II toxin-antitoxin system, parDE [Candidatus Argoarchaeum ethanivorans]CAD6493941.1 MAG: ParE toxin of type II toxin-antitoxin system, parDE [Candidatus Argoarchaeum ethanivorans]